MICNQHSLRAGNQSRLIGHRAVAVWQPRQLRIVTVAVQKKETSFFDNVKRIAKQVQGSLPIVGLVSRLASPEGGFDELAYPEFARNSINHSGIDFKNAIVDLEKKHGKVAGSRWVLLVLWMCKHGVGLVAPRDIILAARRLRVTQDIEIELERFGDAKTVTLKKYSMMERPEGKLADKVSIAVDALCTLCIGLKDGVPVADPDAVLLVQIVREAFPEADAEYVMASIRNREQRAATYA